MKADTPSRTAAWVAAARGLGAVLPADARLIEDPYGLAFASPLLARRIAHAGERALDLRALAAVPGMRTWILYMQVRTRVIDDALRDFLARGGRQLVLLGAGYDCRALRIAELAGATVLEVDHPATQRRKRDVLDRLGAVSPARYVTWNFEQRAMSELPAALADHGLTRDQPVFTIWEGVTMYLTEPAIDASLRAVRAWSCAGSQLAITYFERSRITQPSFATRAVQVLVSRYGEPWRWGWDPGGLAPYLRDRGLAVEADQSMPEAAARLLPAEFAHLIRESDRRFAFAAAGESIAVVA